MNPENEGLPPSDPDELIREYTGLVASVAAHYRKRGLEQEDLRQEGLIGLLKAYKLYDPSKGAKFSTYAVYWIKKQMLLALERESRDSMDAGVLDNEPADQLAAQEPAELCSTLKLPPGMPPLEARILELSLSEGLSLKEIAFRLGLRTERCKQLKLKALRRIRSGYQKESRQEG